MAIHKLSEYVLADDTTFSLINNGQVDYGNKTQTEIDALTPVTGSKVFNTTTNIQQQYSVSSWIDL